MADSFVHSGMNRKFLLYGANGYTGELIARMADQYALEPVLAGRREEAIRPLVEKYGFEYRIFDLSETEKLETALKEVGVVIHAAGPFSATARQMAEACIRTGTHYLDINGDVTVFEFLKGYNEYAKAGNVMLMPGAGFDVVPTDCLAAYLKKKLPDACSIRLAFGTLGGGISHGTAMTIAGRLGEGGATRKKGKIVKEALGKKGMEVDFGTRKLFVMSIPWGDVSTAFHTTGIPDIEVYTAVPRKIYLLLKAQGLFNWLLRKEWIRNLVRRKIKQRPAGPSDEKRNKAVSLVWGEVTNTSGRKMRASFKGPEGYTLTAHSSLILAKKILSGNYSTGYQTPAGCYTEQLLFEIPGIEEIKDLD